MPLTSTGTTLKLNGTGTQDIFSTGNFNNLTINKGAGITTLSSNATVNGILNFITGKIQTGSNILILPATASVTNAAQNSGWVNGNLQKYVATGSNVSRTLEIGGTNYYTPVTVLFASVTTSGDLKASATSTDHPQIAISSIDANKSVNRYWALTNMGIVFTTATNTFNWVASDLDGGVATSNFETTSYNGTDWNLTSFASPLSTSIQATGLTSFGAYAIGERSTLSTWTGAAGTSDWYTSNNWIGGIPAAIVTIMIPTGIQAGRIYPVLNSGIIATKDITIENTATLIVGNAILKIAGSINNAGTLNVLNGTIEMNGSIAQTIPASAFQNNSLKNLIISNTSAAGVTLGGALDINGSLTYSGIGKKLTTNDVLTLKSTALNTAWVGDMTGNTITGKVTVERYISAHKAWQFLSIPTNTTQTVKQTWQEGCGTNLSCIANFGTQITGAGGTAAGFDVYTATLP